MIRIILILLSSLFLLSASAQADQLQNPTTPPDSNILTLDPAASFVTKLFVNACIPNMGRAEKVRAWASEKHLQPITAPIPLHVFVGRGDKGSAWAVPAASGNFALSIRGTSEACAVWARTANPTDVEHSFKKILDGVRRPGIDVHVYEDKTSNSSRGNVRELIYIVSPANAPSKGYLFTMLTSEKAGGAFQASLQVAKTIVTNGAGLQSDL